MKHLLSYLALCTMLIWSVTAEGHRAKHDDAVKPLHGGQAHSAGPYHLELVAKDGELILYVTDHEDKAVSTEGARAKATIQHGYEPSRIQVELQPSGENLLMGAGPFTIHPETAIMIFLKLPDQDAYAARFTPLKIRPESDRKDRGGTSKAGSGDPHQPRH